MVLLLQGIRKASVRGLESLSGELCPSGCCNQRNNICLNQEVIQEDFLGCKPGGVPQHLLSLPAALPLPWVLQATLPTSVSVAVCCPPGHSAHQHLCGHLLSVQDAVCPAAPLGDTMQHLQSWAITNLGSPTLLENFLFLSNGILSLSLGRDH